MRKPWALTKNIYRKQDFGPNYRLRAVAGPFGETIGRFRITKLMRRVGAGNWG
jgi:hypothetical protein